MATLRATHTIYSAGPTVWVRLYADTKSTDVNKNQSTLHCELRVAVSGGSETWWATQGYSAGLTDSGNPSTTSYSKFVGGTETTVASSDLTRTHNDSGDFTWTIGYYFTTPAMGSLAYTTATFAGAHIARGFTSTPTISLKSTTETTATFNFSTSENMNAFEVYVDGSKTSNATGWIDNTKSGTFTVSGLSANKSYKVYVKCNRADTSVQGTSNTVSVTTNSYPYFKAVDNFTIGNACNITLYNPLGRNCTIKMTCNGVTIGSFTTTSTSASKFNDETSIDNLYKATANDFSLQCQLTCTYGSVNYSKTCTVTVPNNATTKPVIEHCYPYENNTNVSAFTGDARAYYYIQNLSKMNMDVYCSANKYASINSVSFTLGGVTVTTSSLHSSDNYYAVGPISTASNGNWSVTVIDTRGFSATYSGTAFTYYNYSYPSINFSVTRTTQSSSTGTATLTGSYSTITIGSNTNKLELYKFKKDNVDQTFDSYSASGGSVSATKAYGDNTLDIESSYSFVVQCKDSFNTYSNEFKFSLPLASPTLWLGKDSAYINNTLYVDSIVGKDDNNELTVYMNKASTMYRWVFTNAGNIRKEVSTDSGSSYSTVGWYTCNGKSSNDLLNAVYPVGSIYMSVNSQSPATLFGGTWEQLKDRFLIGAGSSYTNGSTGGATTHTHTTAGHTLTVNEMPSHQHYSKAYNANNSLYKMAVDSLRLNSNVATWSSAGATTAGSVDGDRIGKSDSTGGGASHSHGNTGSSSNMPPYLAVYMWKRTA